MSKGFDHYICAKCLKSLVEALKERTDGLEDPWEFYHKSSPTHEWHLLCPSCQTLFQPTMRNLEKIHTDNVEKEFLKFIQKN